MQGLSVKSTVDIDHRVTASVQLPLPPGDTPDFGMQICFKQQIRPSISS